MKSSRLPPLNVNEKTPSNHSKSFSSNSCQSLSLKDNEKESNLSVLPTFDEVVEDCKTYVLPSSCCKDALVPFQQKNQENPSPSLTKSFESVVCPSTTPNLTIKEKENSKRELLNRPKISNNLPQSMLEKPRFHSAKKCCHTHNCKSVEDVYRKNSSEITCLQTKPFLSYSFKQFRLEVDRWRKHKRSAKLLEFYRATFESFKSLNDTFKKAKSCTNENMSSHVCLPFVQQKFVGCAYETLLEMPSEIKKVVLKGIINCLLKEWKGNKTDVDLRAYFILLQNPMFNQVETYVIYAHLLRQVATFNERDHSTMIQWFRSLSTPRFRLVVEKLHQFVTLRLFPGQHDNLPPMSNCSWWIPSAIKVLSILNDANNLVKPRLTSFREFYNHALDHIDVIAEFHQWENPSSHSGFTFCQYPFILSVASKLRILKHDQERQMIRSARDDLFATIKRRPTRPPSVDQLFLNITVRRQFLLQDSLEQIFNNRKELKKKLRVEFVGEPGYDMGGLTKEWFLLLLREVLSANNTFVYNTSSRCYWFANNTNENSSDLFLIGVLMGLAVYNCITLDICFPMVCYRKLLSNIPRSSTNHHNQSDCQQSSSISSTSSLAKNVRIMQSSQTSNQLIGFIPVGLDDLKSLDPDLAHGLEELLNYEGNVDEDFGMTFQASFTDLGVVKTVLLKPDGDKIPLTNANRIEYVQELIHYKLNKSIYRQFLAFYHGFYTACSSNALSFLCPEELELLICGNNNFDLVDLKKFTSYQGYIKNEPTIINLWDVLLSLPRDLQKKFLHFCTGSDRVPIGGMEKLNFKVIRTPTTQNMLPMAHTCFNQLLLPPYGSKQQLESKLVIAISNAEGFGLE